MIKQWIREKAETFFEWPTEDKTYVGTTSMLLFASEIADMAVAEERERCARVAEGAEKTDDRNWVPDSLYDTLRKETAADIRRMPSNDRNQGRA